MSAGYDGSIRIDSRIDTAGFDNGVKRMDAGIGTITGGLKKLAGAVGIAFGISALVKFSKAAIDAASDLQEVQNVVDTAFGAMANKAEDFADRAITQFGMSELAAKKTASTYMAMSKSMGLSDQAASDMAISVAGLTGDVASFYNISQDLAGIKLKAIWTGETEGLKDLGVVMTQTNLQAFALAQGITKDISKMTQAEQVTLRYQYVMQQLSLAQGDFAKTSNSWANQTRILSERFKQLLAVLGSGFISALTPALRIINGMMDGLLAMAETISGVLTGLFGAQQTAQKDAATSVDKTTGATEGLGDAVSDVNKELKKAELGFDELNKLSGGTTLTQAPDGSGGATGGLTPDNMLPVDGVDSRVEELTKKIREMFKAWKDAAQPTAESFKRLMEALEPLKTFAAKGISDFYNNLLLPLGRWTLGVGLPGLLDTTSKLADAIDWGKLNDALDRLWRAVQPLAQHIGEGLLWFYDNAIAPMVAWAANDLVPAALDLLSAAFEALDAVIEALAPLAKDFFETILKPLGEWTGEVIINAIRWLTDRLNDFAAWARENPDTFRTIAETIFALLGGILAYHAVHKIGAVIGAIQTAFTSFAGGLSLAQGQAFLASIAFGALILGIIEIAKHWDDMNGIERVVAVLGAITVAAFAAALAVGAFQSALTIGLAVAGIVAGIVAVTAAIASAQSRVDAMAAPRMPSGSFSGGGGFSGGRTPNYPRLATGAVIPPNSEFLAVLGDQKHGRNFEAPEDLLRQIVREETAGNGGATEVSIHFTGSLAQLGRVLNPVIETQKKLRGPKAVQGGKF